jgi:prephenate dehydratase
MIKLDLDGNIVRLYRFGDSVVYTDMSSMTAVLSSITTGEATYGVIPIENSTSGYDVFSLMTLHLYLKK